MEKTSVPSVEGTLVFRDKVFPLRGRWPEGPDEVYKGCLPAKRSSSFAKGEMARFESKIRSAPPFPAGALPFVTCLDEPLATSSPASRELPLKGKPLSGCKKEGASFGAPGSLATSSLVCNTLLCSVCLPSGGPGISLVVLRGLWESRGSKGGNRNPP